jgi:hypothetical protein
VSIRLPILVTAPPSAGVALRVRASDDDGEGRIYSSATSTAVLDQPRPIAAGASLTVYVDGPSVYYVSATANGVEMAGGYNARRRVEAEGGLTRVTVEAPPVVAAAAADRVVAAGAPTNLVAGIDDVTITGTPTGGTYTLVMTVHDLDDDAYTTTVTTAVIAHDDDITAIALACETALIAAGWAGADVSGATTKVTYTFPAHIVTELGTNSMTGGTTPTVVIAHDTVGSNGTRGYLEGTQWVDTTGDTFYFNWGGVGKVAAGTGTAQNWTEWV